MIERPICPPMGRTNCWCAMTPRASASPTSRSSAPDKITRASISDMSQDPVVLGHEISLTVVGVGENLRDQYHVGDRFIVQADIYVNGVGYAYGYEIQGGFSQYNVIDQRVLNGDGGNYLAARQARPQAMPRPRWPNRGPVSKPPTPFAYRQSWQARGNPLDHRRWRGHAIGPRRSLATRPRGHRCERRRLCRSRAAWADAANVKVIDDQPDAKYDDIVVLSNDPDLIERAFATLGARRRCLPSSPIKRCRGVFRWTLGGCTMTTSPSWARPALMSAPPTRPSAPSSSPGGITWILGAGGPMGHMHMQRAIEIDGHPRKIVATNLNRHRMIAVKEKFADARQKCGHPHGLLFARQLCG